MMQTAMQDRQDRQLADRLGLRSRAIIRKATASLLRLSRLHRQRQHSQKRLQPGLKHRPRQQLNRDSRPLLPSDKIRMSGKEFI